MKFPEIPNIDHKNTINETALNLMNSIIKEEEALSQLLNAEAKKIEAFVGKKKDFPTKPTNLDILDFSHSINQVVEALLMKEWLLYRKVEIALQLDSKFSKVNCDKDFPGNG